MIDKVSVDSESQGDGFKMRSSFCIAYEPRTTSTILQDKGVAEMPR